ncbi:MAG: hypothetical protein COY66_01155 [Candidatus Kerfeldbacteria bacterium CG_4_10_14_0_8_um_filter_42_10]|uniref:SCP domain-containing protein n=1 Tax=Candidatus Kerfeldbacteria bacterium CG_4_10_14_0_8_um_filter_42_10 TaxID=2014248 RepID=A0A2M7RK43_9BACT|nr:MAG: hypothetical protein COY66_01155 [Candidatus Kerfeldbacteria bacterium CG_4_10_14_0_8_um_filter_42_10]
MKVKKSLIFFGVFIAFSILLPQTASLATQNYSEVLELTNLVRTKNNLPPLQLSYALTQTAELKAQDMLNNQYFAHISPQGKTPWDWLNQTNYLYSMAGENLAINFNSPEEMMAQWLASPTHRANILDPDFKEMGVAIVSGKFKNNNTILIVQHFGAPMPEVGE